jgi:hypothetical protein
MAHLYVTKISNSIRNSGDGENEEPVGDSEMRFYYGRLLRAYWYLWRTRGLGRGTYRLRADLGDGVVHEVNLSLRR